MGCTESYTRTVAIIFLSQQKESVYALHMHNMHQLQPVPGTIDCMMGGGGRGGRDYVAVCGKACSSKVAFGDFWDTEHDSRDFSP